MELLRLDKWLWAARFFKTRTLASDEITKGRVSVNGASAKPARELRVGDRVELRHAGSTRTVLVRGLSAMRGPAPVAQLLYEETLESFKARLDEAQARRLGGADPAQAIDAGRPTKRDRRQLADWQRWSVSLDDE